MSRSSFHVERRVSAATSSQKDRPERMGGRMGNTPRSDRSDSERSGGCSARLDGDGSEAEAMEGGLGSHRTFMPLAMGSLQEMPGEEGEAEPVLEARPATPTKRMPIHPAQLQKAVPSSHDLSVALEGLLEDEQGHLKKHDGMCHFTKEEMAVLRKITQKHLLEGIEMHDADAPSAAPASAPSRPLPGAMRLPAPSDRTSAAHDCASSVSHSAEPPATDEPEVYLPLSRRGPGPAPTKAAVVVSPVPALPRPPATLEREPTFNAEDYLTRRLSDEVGTVPAAAPVTPAVPSSRFVSRVGSRQSIHTRPSRQSIKELYSEESATGTGTTPLRRGSGSPRGETKCRV